MTTYMFNRKQINLDLVLNYEQVGNEVHFTLRNTLNPQKPDHKVISCKDAKEAEQEIQMMEDFACEQTDKKGNESGG